MTESSHDLLRPSLERSSFSPLRPPFSVRACFWTSVLGGGLTATLFLGLGSQRFGTLRRDLIFLVPLGMIALGLPVYVLSQPESASAAAATLSMKTGQFNRIANRFLGIAVFGVYFAVHRQRIRSMALLNTPLASPWRPAIGCMLVASAVLLATVYGLGLEPFRRG